MTWGWRGDGDPELIPEPWSWCRPVWAAVTTAAAAAVRGLRPVTHPHPHRPITGHKDINSTHTNEMGDGIMAKHTTVRLVDDTDGSDAAGTVQFALDGRDYEIDLSATNAIRLRDTLGPFVGAARRSATPAAERVTTRSRSTARQPTNRDRTSAIRDWARDNGYEVSNRGRIPNAVIAAYDADRPGDKPAPPTDTAPTETPADVSPAAPAVFQAATP